METNWKFRNSRPEVFCKKGVLRNFSKFAGKHLCQSLSFNKVAVLRPATLLKKGLSYRYFPVIWEISKNTFSYRKPLVAASENWNCFDRSSFEYNRLFWDSQITWNIVLHALNSCWRYKYNRDLIWFDLNCFFLTLYWDSGTIPFEHCTLL